MSKLHRNLLFCQFFLAFALYGESITKEACKKSEQSYNQGAEIYKSITVHQNAFDILPILTLCSLLASQSRTNDDLLD